MRKLVFIALALITLQATAQERKKEHAPEHRKERADHLKNLTPEERATLQTKKMTLHLDLTEAQQREIQKVNFKNAEKRQTYIKKHKVKKEKSEGEKPLKEARLKMMNAKLDHQIATKQKMKSILNAEQYEKWEKMHTRRDHKKREYKKRSMKRN